MGKGGIDKTNAARLLDRAGVRYELIPYRVGTGHLSAAQVAAQLGEPVERVFKTLVLRGERTGYFVCVVPGDHAVDLKAAARYSGNKRAELIPLKDLLAVTGYVRGGCSPIGMRRSLPTFIHLSACDFDAIYVSAGMRGLQLRLAPGDLAAFVGATFAPVSRKL